MHRTMLAAAALLLPALAAAQVRSATGWPDRLEADLARVESQHAARIGVYVRDIGTGLEASHRARDDWYLASMIKLPVAIAVLRGVERGSFTLDSPLTLRASDYVDGAGPTNYQPVGARPSIGTLLEPMMIHSDNTATDMLIGLVGIGEVNAQLRSLVPLGFGRITSLADVRRQVYGQLDPAADRLYGHDFILLRQQRTDTERLALLSRLTGTPAERFRLPTLRDAYAAYYDSGVNTGRLDAYGRLLELLADGRALEPAGTAYLLDTMKRAQTGDRRLKAGLPASVRFAHKTGTQRERVCDAGIATVAGVRDQRIVVVACVKGEPSLARSERALQAVGEAIGRSGLLALESAP